ncbi:hypothetical protein DL96DRAFT_1583471 [Flagelloscypha sp. PMI_526]|nr:hypothetical protein DL96DRAFT_1583471 [Flagelloscypha sp. PMI_526]
MTSTMSNNRLLSALEREFCPALDSAVVIALFHDLVDPTNPQQLNQLRQTLASLALDAEPLYIPDEEGDESSSKEGTSRDDSLSEATTSLTSLSLGDISEEDVAFLRAALPHVSLDRLQAALVDAQHTSGRGDMWEVMSTILSEDWIRDLEERGLDALSDDDELSHGPFHSYEELGFTKDIAFGPIQKKQKRKQPQKVSKFVLGDVRQQNLRATPKRRPLTAYMDDPWSQINSLSSYLSQLLSPRPQSFFSSFFHDPKYPTPYAALRAALVQIQSNLGSPPPTDDSLVMLQITLSEILDLAVYATSGRQHEALELVQLLRELDSDSLHGEYGMGVYHSAAPAPSSASVTGKASLSPEVYTKTRPVLPTKTPPPPQPPNQSGQHPGPFAWQKVPERRWPRRPHPYSDSIPAYSANGASSKVKGAGNRFGKGGKGDVGELGRMFPTESIRKRNEYLMKAAEAYRKGNNGGDIAFYYAEEARKVSRQIQLESLDRARERVARSRQKPSGPNEIDLHGVNVQEATTIVQEVLSEGGFTQDSPLRIITGRGAHSANHQSVLKPAIKNLLNADIRWNVRQWDAGLMVWRKT